MTFRVGYCGRDLLELPDHVRNHASLLYTQGQVQGHREAGATLSRAEALKAFGLGLFQETRQIHLQRAYLLEGAVEF